MALQLTKVWYGMCFVIVGHRLTLIIEQHAMSDSSVIPPGGDQRAVVIDMTSPTILERRLEGGTDWLRTSEIMRVLEAKLAEPLPPLLREHLTARLDGTAQKARGPQPESRRHRDLFIWANYYRIHRWLARRRKSVGLVGWRNIRNADWWKGPPAERAARMVQRRLAPMLTWRQVQEIAQRVERELGNRRPQRRHKSVRPQTPKNSRA